MPKLDTLDVWEADKAIDLADWTIGVVSGLLRPSFQAVLLSAKEDVVTLQVAGARQPSGERSALFHVAGRGTFELLRLERWPAAPGSAGERLLLTLRTWPR